MNFPLPYVSATSPLTGRSNCWFVEGADVWLEDGRWVSRFPRMASRLVLNGVRTA